MYPPTSRTTPTRLRERARYDADTVHAILDEALICHLGFVADDRPQVLPTTHARIGDVLYLHGSTGSTPLRAAGTEAGVPVCVTVTLVDGLVLARSAFHHSMNYRSVVAHGRARLVTDPAEKDRALAALAEHVAAGRAADCRAPSVKELAATAVLALPLAEVSAKVRTGQSADEPEDVTLPHWAGVLPLRMVADRPLPSPDLGPVPTPPYLAAYHRGSAPARSPWWTAPTLAGRHVRLEPLGPGHVDGLLAAGADPEVWRWLAVPQPRSREAMTQVVGDMMHAVARDGWVAWAQVDQATGRPAGVTAYHEVSPEHRKLAIGGTWLGRPWWGGRLNPEAKLLLLTRAFDELGAHRVTWHTDLRNERSQRAVERLGAVREGVLRHDRVRPDGTVRDTVVYGMTVGEWPAARDRLRRRLADD